jgi:hypothetical protein
MIFYLSKTFSFCGYLPFNAARYMLTIFCGAKNKYKFCKKVAGTLRNFSEITVCFVSVRKSRSGAGKQAHVCCHGEEEEKKLQV